MGDMLFGKRTRKASRKARLSASTTHEAAPFALRVLALSAGVITFLMPSFMDAGRRVHAVEPMRVSSAEVLPAEAPASNLADYHGASGVWRIAEKAVELAEADPRMAPALMGTAADMKRAIFEEVWGIIGGGAARTDSVSVAFATQLRAAMTQERVTAQAQDDLMSQVAQRG